MFSLICVWINGWVNSREAGDLRGNQVHYDVIVMIREIVMLWKLILRVQIDKSQESINSFGPSDASVN